MIFVLGEQSLHPRGRGQVCPGHREQVSASLAIFLSPQTESHSNQGYHNEHNEIPHPEWLKQKMYLNSPRDNKFNSQVLAGLVSLEAPLPGLQTDVFLLCSTESLYMCV